jgi:type IV pilus assembly protein PilX
MTQSQQVHRSGQSGMVLVSGLLLLLVVTIMALSIFRSFGMQEKIAGNIREKQRALQAAMTTQQFAEWWLANVSNAPRAISQGVAADAAVICVNTTLLDANSGQGQICLNTLLSVSGVSNLSAWPVAGAIAPITTSAGVQYTPPGFNYTGSSTNASVADLYFARPRFYIADLGPLPTGRGEVYQVDAYSFGESQNAIAVVESTVAITCQVCNVGGL